MYSLLLLGLVSAVLALFLTPLVRNLAWHFGIVDQPDQQRKMHSAPIPRTGGVAIFSTIIGAYGLLLVVRFGSGAVVWGGFAACSPPASCPRHCLYCRAY
jgi:UDP-N-acetylmuramyl pentapeptide phosphotransferase/UDP-N-acetylglucosamine-1-phosphate transferase